MKVLSWSYLDGSAFSVVRCYEDDERAKKDFELVSENISKKWELTEVELIKKDGTK